MLLKKGNEKTQQTNREELAKEYLEGQSDFLSLSSLWEKARGSRRFGLEGPLFADLKKKSFSFNSVMKMYITV